jgi:hypothetical protein
VIVYWLQLSVWFKDLYPGIKPKYNVYIVYCVFCHDETLLYIFFFQYYQICPVCDCHKLNFNGWINSNIKFKDLSGKTF